MLFRSILMFLTIGFSCGLAQVSPKNHKIDFISDFQAPMATEKILLKSYRNEEARDSLFADIIRSQPKYLFMTGDMVSAGSRQDAWHPLDYLLGSLKNPGTEVYALPGNHEYIFNRSSGIRNFLERFPKGMLNGYVVNIDSIAIIMINSNFSNLDEDEIKNQLKWYRSTMDSLDSDRATLSIIVCTHHAPFSNSAIVGSSQPVKNLIVPTFENSKKSVLFISGHSHNLEYFAGAKGKHYLVIGGGGGITQPLLAMEKRTNQDLLNQESKPIYFYLTIERNGDLLKISARGFKRDFRFFNFEVGNIHLAPN